MKTAFAAIIVFLFCAGSGAMAQPQTQASPNPQTQAAPQAPDLNAIVLQAQQATSSASVNIGKLRIEKWKTDSGQKQQLQQIADSLQKNIANAMPGLINDVSGSKGSALSSFKLYHNLNVLYEFVSGLADAAGSLGKREEYEPLAADAAAIDTARQNLSTYIEQAVGKLESANRTSAGTTPAQSHQPGTIVPGRKVVVIDDTDPQPTKKRAKSTKKKASTPPAAPASAPPTQSSVSPH
ncbi:MAG TPA: hypothetical protein VGJ51_20380 [Candidatus Angelobacter sp.]